MHATLAVRILLACLSLVAVYTKYYLSIRNGFIPMLAMLKAQNLLPGGEVPLRAKYTMCSPVDNFLAACTLFFWPALSGNCGPLSIYGLAFAGAMVPAWIIVSDQTRQSNNLRRTLVRNLISGLAVQCIGPGVILPALLAMKPWSLATKQRVTPSHYIYLSMLVFYLIPLFLASGATPESVSVDVKQLLIGLWQGWPVYVSISSVVLQCSKLTLAPHGTNISQRKVHAYIFAFVCSAGPHLILLANIGNSLNEKGKSLIAPRLFWGSEELESVEEGVLHFLQWDYSISAVALLIWCITLIYQRTRPETTLVGPGRILWGLVLTIVFGPCSAAIVLYYQAEAEQSMRKEV